MYISFVEYASTFFGPNIFVQACCLSIFAILGSFLRIIIAQLFGQECANPGTVGWLAASSPLCVTVDGDTKREGGIIFADLPSNILGCFFMGLLQDGNALGLPINIPIAWLNEGHIFQSMAILQLGLKTGFCGSLTTFSSWNSEMVVMIFGTGDLSSQFIKALFGYLIGIETALGSYAFGKTVAIWFHKWMNPLLADEGVAATKRAEEGVHINRDLPEFERRFLPNLSMENLGNVYPMDQMQCLERWRSSTCEARRVGHSLLPMLIEIETTIFVNRLPLSSQGGSISRHNNWDADSLIKWSQYRESDCARLPSVSNHSDAPETINNLFTPPVAGIMLACALGALVLGLALLRQQNAYAITDRTSCYAMLLAPLGALTRWQLGKWNGKCSMDDWKWLPIGTLAANVAGSVISITMVATEFRVGGLEGFWTAGTLRAVRVGFAGCLTTVSTFVAEVAGFGDKTHQDRAYAYAVISLSLSCFLSCIAYAIIVYL
jgi:fluoride ion exporter CrcB/FEX